jgi:N utilization substance protein B
MSARSKARKRALDALYEADMRGTDPTATVRERSAQAQAPFNEYALALVDGVVAERVRIDELIATYAEDWTLDRMPPVDRAILRLGAYELLYVTDVPDAVAVSEAVALARELSTDASAGFVNGVLGRLVEIKATLQP